MGREDGSSNRGASRSADSCCCCCWGSGGRVNADAMTAAAPAAVDVDNTAVD